MRRERGKERSNRGGGGSAAADGSSVRVFLAPTHKQASLLLAKLERSD